MIIRPGITGDERELHRQSEADHFTWVHFKSEALRQIDIPSNAYPIDKSSFDQMIRHGGIVSLSDIVRGLMGGYLVRFCLLSLDP